MKLPIEVPWVQAASDAYCLQCAVLLDEPNVKMKRTARLNGARDGYILVEFECLSCGWKPAPLTALLDEGKPEPKAPQLIIPTSEEVEFLTSTPAAAKPQRIIVPEAKPVELGELEEYLGKNLPPAVKIGSVILALEPIKGKKAADSFGEATVGVVRVSYVADELAEKPELEPYRMKRDCYCSEGLPDVKKLVTEMAAGLKGDLKLLTGDVQRVVPTPMFDGMGSRFRQLCAEHRVPADVCGCIGGLRNSRSPGSMSAPPSLLNAPDGSPVPSLKDRLGIQEFGT